MEKRDARKLNAQGKEEVRRQAVKQHLEGKNNSEIAGSLEVHRSTVSGWINRYKSEGLKGLKACKVGRKGGTGMQLSAKQQQRLRKKIVDKNPEQLKMPFALWTREAVGQLIDQLAGKRLDLRQVGRYLKRWGFTSTSS